MIDKIKVFKSLHTPKDELGKDVGGHTTDPIDPTSSVDPQTGAVIELKSARERKLMARLDAILLLYG